MFAGSQETRVGKVTVADQAEDASASTATKLVIRMMGDKMVSGVRRRTGVGREETDTR